MEYFLSLVESPQPTIIDEEKLNFFTTKILVWDHFSMHEASSKSLSVEKKLSFQKDITLNSI